jgi:dihydrofolate reductase
MRKIVAGLFMSVDGIMESPEKWTGPYMNGEVGQAIGSQFAASDTMLLGRRTYETFAQAFAGGTDGMAAQMNSTPKFVVSKTLKSADWQNSTLISGDVFQEIKKLKNKPGRNIAISGSASLVRWLLQNNLLDELNLIVPPVVVGSGRRLFEDGEGKGQLKLIDSKAFSTGVLSLTYAPAGS